MTDTNSRLPLSGIKVLAFTHTVMGPCAGLILADMGADVIHIESPSGDATRRLKGFGKGYFPYFNRNKRSLTVDLKSDEGREIIFNLVKDVDIILENFGPGKIERLGFGYEDMKTINDRLIFVSLKGFMPGPYEKRVAMDELVQMMGGMAYMTGPVGQPLRAGTSVVDITGGMFGALGAITALYDRKRTGKGTYIKSALFETTAFLMGQHMAYSALVEGDVPPMPARVSAWSVYQLFETKDNENVFIGIISDRHWKRFCEVFGMTDWLEDERLATNNDRIDQRAWFLPEVRVLIKRYTKQEVIDLCNAAGICFAPIARPEDLLKDPQLNQGDLGLLETTFPNGAVSGLPRIPLQMGDYAFGKRTDPPQIGQDTEAILESLGYPPDKIKDLRKKKII